MIIVAAKLIGSGLASIGVIGAGIGIGTIFGCYLLALSRNPLLKGELFFIILLGFALVEATALFNLMLCPILISYLYERNIRSFLLKKKKPNIFFQRLSLVNSLTEYLDCILLIIINAYVLIFLIENMFILILLRHNMRLSLTSMWESIKQRITIYQIIYFLFLSIASSIKLLILYYLFSWIGVLIWIFLIYPLYTNLRGNLVVYIIRLERYPQESYCSTDYSSFIEYWVSGWMTIIIGDRIYDEWWDYPNIWPINGWFFIYIYKPLFYWYSLIFYDSFCLDSKKFKLSKLKIFLVLIAVLLPTLLLFVTLCLSLQTQIEAGVFKTVLKRVPKSVRVGSFSGNLPADNYFLKQKVHAQWIRNSESVKEHLFISTKSGSWGYAITVGGFRPINNCYVSYSPLPLYHNRYYNFFTKETNFFTIYSVSKNSMDKDCYGKVKRLNSVTSTFAGYLGNSFYNLWKSQKIKKEGMK